MRIRQIKPAWWFDKDLRTRTSADAREFYIGLWMLADDDGWLEWDVPRIAAELYAYGLGSNGLLREDPIECREASVRAWTDILAGLDPDDPHLVVYDCGHARVPKMPRHQRFGGRPVYGIRDDHARRCARALAVARPGRVGNGTVGNGKGVARTDAQPDGFEKVKTTVAALGLVKP